MLCSLLYTYPLAGTWNILNEVNPISTLFGHMDNKLCECKSEPKKYSRLAHHRFQRQSRTCEQVRKTEPLKSTRFRPCLVAWLTNSVKAKVNQRSIPALFTIVINVIPVQVNRHGKQNHWSQHDFDPVWLLGLRMLWLWNGWRRNYFNEVVALALVLFCMWGVLQGFAALPCTYCCCGLPYQCLPTVYDWQITSLERLLLLWKIIVRTNVFVGFVARQILL